MAEPEIIEVLLAKELQGLCTSCANFETCSYRKASTKIIIQCELYELETEQPTDQVGNDLSGLCVNCCNVDTCGLPDKQFGVWHCEEYE